VQSIALARATHVLAYVEVLRHIGAPVETELRRAKLPTLLPELADRYVPAVQALSFLDSTARREGVDDLGVLATREGTFRRLRDDLQASVRSAPTLYGRLRRFGALVAAENTSLRFSMRREGEYARICLSLLGLPRTSALQYSEWLQIDALIDVIRDAVGPRWNPVEVTFQSRFQIPHSALERFAGVRLGVGCDQTSIVVPAHLLGEFLARDATAPSAGTEVVPIVHLPGFAESLKLALRAYLAEGCPDIDAAAEIAGLSPRTLQRRLLLSGSSYRALLREARAEAAAELLERSGATVLDAAFSVGYTDPSNFSRAFRQVTGFNPRRQAIGTSSATRPGGSRKSR